MKIRRRVAACAAAVLVLAGAPLLVSSPASAHGALMVPGSRTFLCWRDGLTPQGNIVPTNPACTAAVAQGGDTALYNWFAVLRSDAAGRTTGFIPDGSLCSGGNPMFSGFDIARADYPVTHLTAGGDITFSYNDWAKHPGTFFLYVTKDTWSPTRPLAWSDLEPEPFSTVTDPVADGGPGTVAGHYTWTGKLPANKTGRHIIYSRWVRSDSPENFFGCSDVVFDGGNGEVTGIGDPGPPPEGGGTAACFVTFVTTTTWPGGFQAEGTVKAAPNAINGWTVSWTAPPGVTIDQVWNGNLLPNTNGVVQVRNASWNGQLAVGSSATFGLTATTTGGPSIPSAVCSSP